MVSVSWLRIDYFRSEANICVDGEQENSEFLDGLLVVTASTALMETASREMGEPQPPVQGAQQEGVKSPTVVFETRQQCPPARQRLQQQLTFPQNHLPFN